MGGADVGPSVLGTRRAAMVLLLVVGIVGCSSTGSSDRAAPDREAPRSVSPKPVEVLGEQVTRDDPVPGTSTTPPTLAPTTAPPPVPDSLPAPEPSRSTLATTCADALAFLAAHQAPGFDAACAAGSALGHLGFTCVDQPGMCAGTRIIRIACPAPFVYMNEAHNSWVLIGARTGIDPYGQGSAAERAACADFR